MSAEKYRRPGSVAAVLALGFLLLGGDRGRAVEVDVELLLLVDVTKSVSDSEFALMMSGYADAFESAGVVDALQRGDVGSIAAAMVFYSDKSGQAVGLDWMQLSNEADAQAFASSLRSVVRGSDKNKTSIAEALNFAVPLFGTETGAAGNGFESARQVIQITGDGADDHSPKTGGSVDTTVANARDAALASGVDVINALTVGAAGSVDAYFAQYVVGGLLDGMPAVVTNVENFAGLGPALMGPVMAPVPEPALCWLLGSVALMVLGRRKRAPVR